MAHGAAHDAAQHVTAAVLGRQNAVGDQEGGCAQMVGDYAMGDGVEILTRLPGDDNDL